MTDSPPKSGLAPLRDRLRRIQFVIGLGFAALVLGAMIQAAIVVRVMERLEDSHVAVMLLVHALVSRLWVYAVLPLICYGAARIIPLRPLSTALGAAVVGELFYVALDFVTGALSFNREFLIQAAIRIVTLAAGVAISVHAIRRGRAEAEAGQQKVRAAAEAKKEQYAEFAREAERVAALNEERRGDSVVAISSSDPTSSSGERGT